CREVKGESARGVFLRALRDTAFLLRDRQDAITSFLNHVQESSA
ncbi:hypothetical protein ACVWXY_002773, partial [Thermostichus sp. MS-CIW-39]